MMKKYIFLSYSSRDIEKVKDIRQYLENNGIKCWTADRDIAGGKDYRGVVVNAITDCAAFVLIASTAANASDEVSSEVSTAFSLKKNIQVFRIENFEFSDNLIYNLRCKQWTDAFADWEEACAKLLSTLRNILGEPIKTTATREDIATNVKKLSQKYAYCLLNRISNSEEYDRFCVPAQKMFSLLASGSYKNKRLTADIDYVNFIADEILAGNHTFRIHGRPGIGKNMLVQLVFLKLLNKFTSGESNALPIYISSGYYEKYEYDGPANIGIAMEKNIRDDIAEYLDFLDNNKDVHPVVLLEGVREYSFARVFPEKIIFDIFKKYGNYSRVIAIDTNLVNVKSRLKKFIAIAGAPRDDYYIKLDAIPIEDETNVKQLISCVAEMYTDEHFEANVLYNELKRLKYIDIDIFLVRLIAHEIMSYEEIGSVSDMYYRFISKEYYYDDDRIYEVARTLFNYIFFDGATQSEAEYDGKIWSFPNKHHTYLGYLIAYYFVKQIQNYKSSETYEFFKVILTSTSDQFIESMLHKNYVLQKTYEEFITSKFDAFDIRQKCNAAYWLGHMDCDSRDIKNFAITFLTRLLTTLKPLVSKNNKQTQDNLDNHMLFRSVCTGLMRHDQANMLDEYLCLMITNDIANAVNRGASVEYFGEGYQIGEHNTCNLDNDYSLGESAIKALCARVEAALNSQEDKFVENNLITLLMLLQARIQSSNSKPIYYDVDKYVKISQKFLTDYKIRPHNISSQKIKDYLESVDEDFTRYVNEGRLDVATLLYNKLQGLKYVKREQWHNRVNDLESMSEHMFGAWMLAMLFLPEAYNQDGYNKGEILDMLLVHDMAQIENEVLRKESVATLHNDIQKNDFLRKLFLKGTYPNVANLTHFYDVSTAYCSNTSLNARIAHDINTLQSIYMFLEYLYVGELQAEDDEIKQWLSQKEALQTPIGSDLFNRLIETNLDFKNILSKVHMK